MRVKKRDPLPDARRLVLANTQLGGTERIGLDGLGGRVFSEALICPFDVPHFDNSQVDGYALRAADHGPRRIVGESAAGGTEAVTVGAGEAVRIFTGARMPGGADAVVMQEDARLGPEPLSSPGGSAEGGDDKAVLKQSFGVDSQVERGRGEGQSLLINEPVTSGQFIRRQGEEIVAGTAFDVVGRTATPPLVGLAASFGLSKVAVYRQPRMTIVGTGSELVAPGQPLERGQIYASNPEALAAALRALGIADVQTRLVGDDPASTRDVLAQGLEADVLITVGGVSVGDHDLVRPTLAALGVEELLWRVSMKPGKPFYFGKKGDKLVFGLPGNPVSALVTFALLVRPALRRTMGLTDAEEETAAHLGGPFERKDLRYEFVRATLAEGIATPVEAQGSHMQTGLAFADALIHVPDGVVSLEEGATVTITPLRWGTY